MPRLSSYLAAALLVLTAPSSAEQYYVSPGGSDAGRGTREKPWQTISKASASLKPGDTVEIRAGTYDEAIQPAASGTGEGARIT